jgi:hypothetical protein
VSVCSFSQHIALRVTIIRSGRLDAAEYLVPHYPYAVSIPDEVGRLPIHLLFYLIPYENVEEDLWVGAHRLVRQPTLRSTALPSLGLIQSLVYNSGGGAGADSTQLLLQADSDGQLPLFLAIRWASDVIRRDPAHVIGILSILLNACLEAALLEWTHPPDSWVDCGSIALSLAVSTGIIELVRLLTDKFPQFLDVEYLTTADRYCNIVSFATLEGHLEVFHFFMSKMSPRDICTILTTPIHTKCRRSMLPIHVVSESIKSAEIASWILHNAPETSLARNFLLDGPFEWTLPIHDAVQVTTSSGDAHLSARLEIVMLFIQYGPPDMLRSSPRSGTGELAIHMSVAQSFCDFALIKCLAEAAPDTLEMMDSCGRLPIRCFPKDMDRTHRAAFLYLASL